MISSANQTFSKPLTLSGFIVYASTLCPSSECGSQATGSLVNRVHQTS
ncbi:hypothetical protein PANA5342_1461 [Pantoea ananatis LMG 5342]|nr:hypothetical protein PANA5342_1461 [Pantoea ananatis LMG 5342]